MVAASQLNFFRGAGHAQLELALRVGYRDGAGAVQPYRSTGQHAALAFVSMYFLNEVSAMPLIFIHSAEAGDAAEAATVAVLIASKSK